MTDDTKGDALREAAKERLVKMRDEFSEVWCEGFDAGWEAALADALPATDKEWRPFLNRARDELRVLVGVALLVEPTIARGVTTQREATEKANQFVERYGSLERMLSAPATDGAEPQEEVMQDAPRSRNRDNVAAPADRTSTTAHTRHDVGCEYPESACNCPPGERQPAPDHFGTWFSELVTIRQRQASGTPWSRDDVQMWSGAG